MIKFENEQALEKFLIENNEFLTGSLSLGDGDFYSQFDIKGYGRVDILHVETSKCGSICITVIELKNEKLKLSHAAQLCRYMKCFRNLSEENSNVYVRGVLIGQQTFPSGTDDCFLFGMIEDVEIFEYSIDIDGLKIAEMGDYVPSQNKPSSESIMSAIGVKK